MMQQKNISSTMGKQLIFNKANISFCFMKVMLKLGNLYILL